MWGGNGQRVLPLDQLVRHIRKQRRLLELTQGELAAASGTSQSFIAKLERGRLNPGYETVRRIVEALDSMRLAEEATAADLMQTDAVWAEPDETLGLVLTRMKENGFSQMPILDDGVPVGSLSEASILRRIDRGADLDAMKRQPVRLVMGASFPTVARETRRHSLVELLREHEAVLVMDGARLVGVVTKSDLW